jgi:hypothetical protein
VNKYLFFQACVAILFISPYFFPSPILYGEALYFVDWSIGLTRTRDAWINYELGMPPGIGVGNNYPFVYILAFLESFGISNSICQAILFCSLFYLPFFFFYKLSNEIFKNSNFDSFLFASFYIYNPLFYIQWLNVNPWLMSIYYLVPCTWYLIGRYWESNYLTAISIALIFTLSVYTYANPPFLIVYLFSILIAGLFYKYYFNSKKNLLYKLSVIYIALFISSFFIVFTIFLSLGVVYSGYLNNIDTLSILLSNSKWSSLARIFTMRQISFDDISFSFYQLFIENNFTKLFSVLPVLLIAILVGKLNKCKEATILFFFILVLIFLITAINPPFGYIYYIFFKYLPFFSIFKTSPEKFSPLLIFLITLILSFIYKNKKLKINIRLMVISYLLIMAIPIYFFKLIPDIYYLGNKITHFYDKNNIVKIIDYINKDDKFYNIISFPASKSNVVLMKDSNGKGSYLGLDPIASSINNDSIHFYHNNIASNLIFSSGSDINLLLYLQFFSVKYLINNSLIDGGFGIADDFDYIAQFLKKSKFVSLALSHNNIDLYKITGSNNIIFIPNKLINVKQESSISDIKKILSTHNNSSISIIFNSDNKNINIDSKLIKSFIVNKINNSLYKINYIGRELTLLPIQFSNNYNSNFNLLFCPKTVNTSVSNIFYKYIHGYDLDCFNISKYSQHKQSNGYSNIWLLNVNDFCLNHDSLCKRNNEDIVNLDLIINYKYDYLLKLSNIIYISFILLLLILFITRKFKK